MPERIDRIEEAIARLADNQESQDSIIRYIAESQRQLGSNQEYIAETQRRQTKNIEDIVLLLGKIDEHISKMDERIAKNEQRHAEMDERFNILLEEIRASNKRIDKLESPGESQQS